VIEGTVAGGAARAFVSGEGLLLRLEIAPAAFRVSDHKQMEELVASAVRDAQEKAHKRYNERMDGQHVLACGSDA